jgi:HEAT repeat protein
MSSVYGLLCDAARGLRGVDQRLVREILAHGQQAVPDLVRFAGEKRDDFPVDLEPDLLNLFRALRTAESIPFLTSLLRDRPDELGEEVVSAFRELAQSAVGPLVELYEELGEERGQEIPFLLCTLGVNDPRIVEIVSRRLESDPWDAAMCIQILPVAEFRPPLEAAISRLPEEHPDYNELEAALEAVANPHPLEQPEPFDIWPQYPEEADPAFEVLCPDALLKFLDHPSPDYRKKVAEALQNEDLTPELVSRLLDLARTDPDAVVRGACWEALGGALEDRRVLDSLKRVVADEAASPVERCGALIAFSEDPEYADVVHRWAEHFYGTPEVRAKAMRAMWRTFDRRYAGYFPRHLDDEEEELQREAIWGVGYLGIGREAGRLEKMFDDEDLREHALFAYALCVPAEITRGRMKGLFRRIEHAASGLSEAETDLVESALDQRLAMHGLEPVFHKEPADDGEEGEQKAEEEAEARLVSAGRNDPCPCGSGRKYKKCCGAKT